MDHQQPYFPRKRKFTFVDGLHEQIDDLHKKNEDLRKKNDSLYDEIDYLHEQLRYQKSLVDFFMHTSRFFESLNANNQTYIGNLHVSMSNQIPLGIRLNLSMDMKNEYERFACTNRSLCEQHREFEDKFKSEHNLN